MRYEHKSTCIDTKKIYFFITKRGSWPVHDSQINQKLYLNHVIISLDIITLSIIIYSRNPAIRRTITYWDHIGFLSVYFIDDIDIVDKWFLIILVFNGQVIGRFGTFIFSDFLGQIFSEIWFLKQSCGLDFRIHVPLIRLGGPAHLKKYLGCMCESLVHSLRIWRFTHYYLFRSMYLFNFRFLQHLRVHILAFKVFQAWICKSRKRSLLDNISLMIDLCIG